MKRFIFFAVIFYCQLNAMQQLASKAVYSSKVFTANVIQHKIALPVAAFTSKQNFCTNKDFYRDFYQLKEMKDWKQMYDWLKKKKPLTADQRINIDTLGSDKAAIIRQLKEHRDTVSKIGLSTLFSLGSLSLTGPCLAGTFYVLGKSMNSNHQILGLMLFCPSVLIGFGITTGTIFIGLGNMLEAGSLIGDDKFIPLQVKDLKKQLKQIDAIQHEFLENDSSKLPDQKI